MTQNKLNQDLIELLSHCRDLSVRDGQQSLDGNKMRIENIVPVLQELNSFYVLARDEYGLEIPPTEVWGGGTVKQPINFNGEDPLDNLKQMRDAAPDLILQDLYRGRQGYGFQPTSREVQFAATDRAYELGIRSHRIFDMMNDMDNLRNGIEAVKAVNAKNPNDPMKTEGAISYISEPDGQKVWTPQDYADFAANLIEEGCDDIVIKDYAGLLVDEAETKSLIATIQKTLAERFPERTPPVQVSLHSHGHKPETLGAALEAGAQYVDTAIGDLSEGTSHTNMRSFINQQMKAKGHNLDELKEHPLMQKLAKVEKVVEHQTLAHKPYRIPEGKGPSKKEVARYRFAGGAYASHFNMCLGLSRTDDVDNPQAQKLYKASLEVMPALWEAAGRFNTVTPGALILSREAIVWASLGNNADKILELVEAKNGEALTTKDLESLIQPKLKSRTQAYKDVVMGRYGRNRGMEKAIGNQDMRAMFLLEDGLKQVFDESNPLDINGRVIIEGMEALELKNKELDSRARITVLNKLQGTPHPEALRQSLVAVMKNSKNLTEEQRDKVLSHFDVGRFPDPTIGLEIADDMVKNANDNGIDLNKTYEKGEADARLLAALAADGTSVALAEHLTNYLASDKKEIPVGSKIEPPRSFIKGALQSIEPQVRELANVNNLKAMELKASNTESHRFEKISKKSDALTKAISQYMESLSIDSGSEEYKQAYAELESQIAQTRPKGGNMQDHFAKRQASKRVIGEVRTKEPKPYYPNFESVTRVFYKPKGEAINYTAGEDASSKKSESRVMDIGSPLMTVLFRGGGSLEFNPKKPMQPALIRHDGKLFEAECKRFNHNLEAGSVGASFELGDGTTIELQNHLIKNIQGRSHG